MWYLATSPRILREREIWEHNHRAFSPGPTFAWRAAASVTSRKSAASVETKHRGRRTSRDVDNSGTGREAYTKRIQETEIYSGKKNNHVYPLALVRSGSVTARISVRTVHGSHGRCRAGDNRHRNDPWSLWTGLDHPGRPTMFSSAQNNAMTCR
jgi:hypothetical protein